MSHFTSRTAMSLIAVVLLIAADVAWSASGGVGHSHHMKRQQQQLPQLTLDVEHHTGIEHNPAAHPMPEYYFSQDQNLLFNFTCTIKHPSYKYKLTMTKEQVFHNGDKGAPIDLIDPNDYNMINPAIKDSRYSVEFTEPSYPDGARYIRISLIVKHMKLEDNGIFTCKYSTITKRIHARVYKHPSQKDILFPVSKSDKLPLNVPTAVQCRVNDVYPKPRIGFSHSHRELTDRDYTERDTTVNKQLNNYMFSVTSAYNFTPSYADNNQMLSCIVNVTGAQNNATLTKQLQLNVVGVQILENECSAVQGANPGQQDFKIECVFFSSPKKTVSFWETSDDAKVDAEDGTSAAAAAAAETSASPVAAGTHAVATGAAAAAAAAAQLRVNDGDDLSNYQASVEAYGAANSGLYKATLKIKEVRVQDFKNYTFKVDRYERVIRLSKGVRDAALTGTDSHAVCLLHSNILLALGLVNFAVLVR